MTSERSSAGVLGALCEVIQFIAKSTKHTKSTKTNWYFVVFVEKNLPIIAFERQGGGCLPARSASD